MLNAWLDNAPDWAVLIGFILVPAAATVVIHVLIRRFVPPARLSPHHDVAGFLVAVIGVMYAVVLGFVVVTVWETFDSAQQNADLEAGYVGDAFGASMALPEPIRTRMQRYLAAYALEVRDVEFGMLRHHEQDPRARLLLLDVLHTLLTEQPPPGNLVEAVRDQVRYSAVVASVRQVADARRLRLIQAETRLPRAMYLALVLGGLMVMVFVFLFGVENRRIQFVMTATVAGCIGLLFGLIVEFSAPFTGSIRISHDAWTLVIENNQFAELAKGVREVPFTAP